MIHTDSFLSEMLQHQTLAPNATEVTALAGEGEKIKKLITDKFGTNSVYIYEGGSKAKGTMVRCAYDYDLAVYADSESTVLGKTLDDMAVNIEDCLNSKYRVKPKTIALQLRTKHTNDDGTPIGIDVVVGRYSDYSRGDAFLAYRGSEKDRLKTNLRKNILHVRTSGCVDIIMLAKIWKVSRGLDEIKTFPLELAVIKILAEPEAPRSGRSERLHWVFERLESIAESMAIEDPANPSGNNIDRAFGSHERKLLRSEAERAMTIANKEGWAKLFSGIDTGIRVTRAALLSAGLSSIAPVRPYSD